MGFHSLPAVHNVSLLKSAAQRHFLSSLTGFMEVSWFVLVGKARQVTHMRTDAAFAPRGCIFSCRHNLPTTSSELFLPVPRCVFPCKPVFSSVSFFSAGTSLFFDFGQVGGFPTSVQKRIKEKPNLLFGTFSF